MMLILRMMDVLNQPFPAGFPALTGFYFSKYKNDHETKQNWFAFLSVFSLLK